MKRLPFFITLILLFGSCARNVGGRSASEIVNYEEDLSSVRPIPVLTVEPILEEIENKEKQPNGFMPSEPSNENLRIDKAVGEISKYNSQASESPGFRIQVFSGNSRGDYEAAKGYLLQHFPELEIYETYSQPTYRIKVGDFLRRMDAEKYYSSLRTRFTSSKITMEAVNVKNGLHLN
ncbi:SPOR domain-containing protein [Jiulongibacter sp. NS-SX5]|uniref:SPOR domain-containing protein n=1 Tax=Jiulongibacter sp. NS-SX5 TaxID=3463854 RepID=UPI00405A1798